MILTDYHPVVVSPGDDVPDSMPLVALVHSFNPFFSDKVVAHSPEAVFIELGGIELGDECSTVPEDLLATGHVLVEWGEAGEVAKAVPSDVALTIVTDGVPLGFTHMVRCCNDSAGLNHLPTTDLTFLNPQNLTASLVSWLSLFPVAPRPIRPTSRDNLASFHHPSTPYGFGLALLAIYSSTTLSLPVLPEGFEHDTFTAWIGNQPAPTRPTLLFAPSAVVRLPMYYSLLQQMRDLAGWTLDMAKDGKIRLLREGILTKDTQYDEFFFKHVRKDAHLDELRAIVFEGPAPTSQLETLRAILGVPVITTQSHSFLLAPIAAPLMYDTQRLPAPGRVRADLFGHDSGPVGPPVPGVELKLVGLEADIAAGRVRGEVLLRSPMLPPAGTLPQALLETEPSLPPLPAYPGSKAGSEAGAVWLRTGIKAEMAPEGNLWISSA